MPINVIKVVLPSVLTFFLGVCITPFFTNFFYKYKMWKKNPRTEAGDITSADFTKLHNTQSELSTPRVGGVIIWVAVLLTVAVIFLTSKIFPTDLTLKLNFFSRSQTLIPLATLIFASLIGLVDDGLQIVGKGAYAKDSIIYRRVKVGLITDIGFLISLWFYYKLGATSIHMPFWYDINLGWMFIPFFIIIMLAVFSTSVIDGTNGIPAGSIPRFNQNQIGAATLGG
jgi:phospho-N-acetylmuramoyl-pentapeptide-transferase